jgi:hypothetical protein
MSLEYRFSHDLCAVLASLQDPDFIQTRSQALGEHRCSCEVQREGDVVLINTVRVVSLNLPKVALKFFNARQTMAMAESWRPDGAGWKGHYHVDIAEQPLTIDATFSLMPAPGGCVFRIQHKPSIDIPMVKKPAEKFVTRTLEEGTRAECDYLRDRLA